MAPSVLIDGTSDFQASPAAGPHATSSQQRTLLLSPPSVSAHPELLSRIVAAHDRNVTDIQMVDRLAAGLVALPASTYDLILLLSDADGTRQESQRLLERKILVTLADALKVGGKISSQDRQYPQSGPERSEAVLAGLSVSEEGVTKPAAAGNTVKLNFGRKANAAAKPLNQVEAKNISAQPRGDLAVQQLAPAGVGFVDFSDDFGMDDGFDDDYIPSKEELMDGDQIDPDSLLTEEDRKRPIIIRKSHYGNNPIQKC